MEGVVLPAGYELELLSSGGTRQFDTKCDHQPLRYPNCNDGTGGFYFLRAFRDRFLGVEFR